MRDKTRIKKVLKLIETIWNKYPDKRLGQLLLNAVELDFNTEDNVLIQALTEQYMSTKYKCSKCKDTGGYMYDENHGKICEVCCPHTGGWWVLREHYGKDNGKFCCLGGCGYKLAPSDVEEMYEGEKVYHLYQNGVLWGLVETKKQANDIKKRLSPENRKGMKIQFGYYIPGG